MAKILPANLERLHSSQHRALIFDCDGTVGDTMGLHYAAWKQTLRDFGAAAIDVPWEKFCGEGGRDVRISIREFAEQCGLSIDGDRFLAHMDALFERYLPYHRPIGPVISFINSETRPMAVASSGFRKNVRYVIDHCGLSEKIRAVVTREDVTGGGVVRTKPAPDLFLIAAERLKTIPTRCLVFGDSPLDGQAAAAAGMDFFRVPQDWWDPALRDFDWERAPSA
ncbi:MAG: HAD family phosphatase [Puniceicoccales bacterium]|jgi:HAD superfamily hydrolase (TIGR01509 family)|nr:HAD family phosphatase [Puniceicoccales bacterium]